MLERRYWTNRQRQLAHEMRARGKSYGQIAQRIGRSNNAVAVRLRYDRLQSKAPDNRISHLTVSPC